MGAIATLVTEVLDLPTMPGTRADGEPHQPAENTALGSGSLRDLFLDKKATAIKTNDGKDGENTNTCGIFKGRCHRASTLDSFSFDLILSFRANVLVLHKGQKTALLILSLPKETLRTGAQRKR